MRVALIGILVGMLLGGGTVGALTTLVLQEHTAEIEIMASDVHAIRRDFSMGNEMVIDGAKRADAMAQARAGVIRPAIAKQVKAKRK